MVDVRDGANRNGGKGNGSFGATSRVIGQKLRRRVRREL